MNKDDEQKYLQEFNGYFPPWNRDAGVISQIQEALESIRNMSDESLEEKVKEAERLLKIHERNDDNINTCWSCGNFYRSEISDYDTRKKYGKLVRELRDLYYELRKGNTEKPNHTRNRERERERERTSSKQTWP